MNARKLKVLSIKQINDLINSGLKIEDPLLSYVKNENKIEELVLTSSDRKLIPTLTFQEIIELLPKSITYKGVTYMLRIIPPDMGYYTSYKDFLVYFNYDNILLNAYYLLLWNLKRTMSK